MSQQAVLLGLAIFATTAGEGAGEERVETKDNAVLCLSPSNLIAAQIAGLQELKSLSCATFPKGIPGVLIEYTDGWAAHVLLRPPNSPRVRARTTHSKVGLPAYFR